MGEWGFLPTYNSSLKSSGDNLTQRYWTSEAMMIAALTQQNQAAVGYEYGGLIYSALVTEYVAFCKKVDQ